MAETVSKVMNLLPEHQEKYLKDLLANIFQYDEETGEITGIAAESPLFGTPVTDPETGAQMYQAGELYERADGTATINPDEAVLTEDGSPKFHPDAGGYVSDPSLASLDQYDQPIFAVEGGVAPPDVMGFTDSQVEAIMRLTGGVDPVTGEQYDSMLGSYLPYLDKAEDIFDLGVSALEGSLERYDPQGQIVYDTDPVTGERTARVDAEGNVVREGGYKDFYDPFVEDVIETSQADIAEALEREKGVIADEAATRGAFGSRRDLIEGEAIGRSSAEEGKLGAELRSAAYTGAQTQAQSAFENQQGRGQTAAQLFGTLGTGIGALGEATQALGFNDINTLFNTGTLEQNQLQAELDVQRAGQIEEAYEPFARFSYMRDILSGVPSSGTSLAAAATPSASTGAGILSTANSIYGAGGGSNPILGGLSSLRNVSGA